MGHPTYIDQGPVVVLTPGTVTTDTVAWPDHLTGDLGLLFVLSKNTGNASGSAITQSVIDGSWEFSGRFASGFASPPAISWGLDVYYRVAESTSEDDVEVTMPSGPSGPIEITQAFICTVRGYDPDIIIDSVQGNSDAYSGSLVQLDSPNTSSINCLLIYVMQVRMGDDFSYNSAAFPLDNDSGLSNVQFQFQDVSTIESGSDDGTTIIVGTADEDVSGVSDHFVEVSNASPSPDPWPGLSGFPFTHHITVAVAGTEDEEPEVVSTLSAPFPDALSQEGYQNNFGDEIIEIPLSGGLSRRRLDSYFAGHMVTVQWLLNRQEYAQFMGFFKTTLRHAVDPFLIDLITDIGVPTTHKARTVGGFPTLNRQSGEAYYVSCTLQCERNPTYTGNIIYQEDGDIVFAVDNPTFAEGFEAGDTLRIIDSAGIHPTGSTPINLDGEYTVLSTTGFNVVTLDNPANVNSDWTVLAGLGVGIEYGDAGNGNVISTITRVPT